MVEINKTVQFNDTSTGTISLSEWDFGDGSPIISGAQVTHVYTNPGNYTVTHRVTGTTGQVQTCVQTISVTQAGAIDWKSPYVYGAAALVGLAILYAATKGGGNDRRPMRPRRYTRAGMY